VILVGDIDRGGVFAQLYGTVALLEEEEKRMIKGLVINKFRGDKTILDPGVEMLEKLTDLPIIGVTPYLHVSLEDEDSLSERLDGSQSVGLIDIAVIRLPRIANFTDFNVFEGMEGVSLRYVSSAHQLGDPDLIILPGTKNTMRDLLWMRQNGLEASVLKAHKAGSAVFGICGGYQMLGQTIADPDGVEEGGTIRGMGLLDTDTIFEAEKSRTRVTGTILEPEGILAPLAGTSITGYEIHMGRTALREGAKPFTQIADSITGKRTQEGACGSNVYGSYVHGIFDSEAAVGGIVRALAEAKGITEEMGRTVDFAAFKESQYDLLADGLREHLDMEAIYRILEEGI
jgi:adenosylcobyric acid synthase